MTINYEIHPVELLPDHRLIFLDTETTGLTPQEGHRIVEIAAIEYIHGHTSGRVFHTYLNPDREIDAGAQEVHGLTLGFLANKPRFEEVADDFIHFIAGANLVIHNAPFDLSFLNSELDRAGQPAIHEHCNDILDSLKIAKSMRPGKRNSLDALCLDYGVDISMRALHGTLLDAELLAEVYCSMIQDNQAAPGITAT